ncbi:glycosyltransferase family 2 protein [Nesterenkonia sp. NBAIMH1]|uniref:glycosyltransferase family 2 protein n=1 Tax=Nesterenkonia sp. NBAIMH1 TaxID=2600320 RepID=UPI0011B641A0|nr:glycosyltransferase [Nesterenkonia sp. NBAIMH1]
MHPALSAEDVWVLVCTYRRPELLARLLRSLEREGVRHLILVDNAPTPDARPILDDCFPSGAYIHQPKPGLVRARNTSLDAVPAEASAVIFLDDDETVDPGWFDALLACARASSADAVSGPVVADFDGPEPEWISTYGFVRRTDRPTGPGPKRLATNNTLVRAKWFAPASRGGLGLRFHAAFNTVGGEDSDLFDRLREAGAVFWWCAEAAATEHVPAERATREWLRSRALRGGHVRALKRRLRTAPTVAGTVRVSLSIGAEGAARALYGALRRTRARLGPRQVTYTDDYYLCEGVGMLASLIGRGREEYARPAADEPPTRP